MSWTDDPLTSVVRIKHKHIEELRDQVDYLQSIACPTDNGSYDFTAEVGVQNFFDSTVCPAYEVSDCAAHYTTVDDCDRASVDLIDNITIDSTDNHSDNSADNNTHQGANDAAIYIGNYTNDDGSNFVSNDAVNQTNDDSSLNISVNSGNLSGNCSGYCYGDNFPVYSSEDASLCGVNDLGAQGANNSSVNSSNNGLIG